MNRSDKIVIVGGGTAGWFSATTLNRFFPKKEIVVIESPDVPRVGVGESTLAFFTFWLHAMNIDRDDLFRYCDGSYKLSIKFTDFHKKDDGGFHYPFGKAFAPKHIYQDHELNAWQYKKYKYPDTPVQDFCRTFWPQLTLVENNRIHFNEKNEFGKQFNWTRNSAMHFDAVMFANFLRDQICIKRGVTHIPSTVKKINVDENGIKNVVIEDGTVVEGDLFIDCTGWKSLLLNELNPEWISYNHLIPNNRAWATKIPYTDKRIELQSFTNGTALGNGWAWNIPCYSRIGAGYAYSDKFIDKESALQEFKDYLRSNKMAYHDPNRDVDNFEYKDIEMRIGIHKEIWIKNCIAIGLSAGFIEPLESTGLFTTHEFLMRLAEVLTNEGYNKIDVNSFNQMCRGDFDGFCKFVSIHYALSQRDDTQYWKDVRNRDYNGHLTPEGSTHLPLRYSEDYFMNQYTLKRFYERRFDDKSGTTCIMVGHNVRPISDVQIVRDNYYGTGPSFEYIDDFVEYIIEKSDKLKQKWLDATLNSSYLSDYLEKTYHS